MKILIGGSPCTHWSIAQTRNRETEASGIGWELFLNYRIARDKYQPDYFLYENNKSMSQAIRKQISKELGVEPVLINSALVSAQNRQRLYWVGKREPDGTYSQVAVEQPADRGILLRDILESGVCWNEKGRTLKAQYYKNGMANFVTNGGFLATAVAEPVCVNSKSGRGGKPGLQPSLSDRIYSVDGKATAVTTAFHPNVAVPAVSLEDQGILSDEYYHGGFDGPLIGMVETPMTARNGKQPSQHCRVYSCDDKYPCIGTDSRNRAIVPASADGKQIPVYEVRNGQITIKGKQYPIKLADGFYIIRKLTVTECKRLQTVPDTYTFPVSDTQAYKMLGNGWTVDVIAHIMSHFDGLTAESVEVLSMYDGMSCGHIALDKLGVEISAYYATEIDKYAIQTTQQNYPDTVQLGDAFHVREEDWTIPETNRDL